MRQSRAVVAVVAVLMAAMSVSVFARGQSGGGGREGHGGHGFSGAHGHAGHVAPHRHFGGGARVGVIIGVPLVGPWFYPAPSLYYWPPPAYIEQAPTQAYWYFCPELNAYHPYVQECPGGWQPVLAQPPR